MFPRDNSREEIEITIIPSDSVMRKDNWQNAQSTKSVSETKIFEE